MNLDLDLDLLRHFVARVDGRSLAGAAKMLGVARATVRRNVEELERRAGTPLLFRGPDGLVVTEAGRVLASHAREMIAGAAALLTQAHTIGTQANGLVRMAVPIGMPSSLIGPMMAIVRSRWPGLRVDMVSSAVPSAELLVRADIAMTVERNPSPGPWECLELGTLRQWLVASPVYLKHRGRPAFPEELVDHDLLLWRSPEGHSDSLALTDGRRLSIAPFYIGDSIHTLREMAAAGAGIAYLPDAQLKLPGMPAAALEIVLADHIGTRRPLRLLVPRALEATPRTRAIVEMIQWVLSSRVGQLAEHNA